MKRFFKTLKSFYFSSALMFIFVPYFIWGGPAEIPYRLDKATVGLVGDVKAEVCVWNDAVFIEMPPSSYHRNPFGGSLLGLIISEVIDATKNKNSDSAKNKNIEKAVNYSDTSEIVAPLKAMIEDIDFRDALHAALLPMVNELSWPHIIDLKDRDGSIPVSKKDFLNKVNERSLLDIQCIYQLSPNAEVLKILTEFTLYLKGSVKPAVAGSVIFTSDRIGKFDINDEAIALWAEYDGAAFRKALKMGIEETVKMLKIVLLSVGPKSALGPDSKNISVNIRTQYEEAHYRPKYKGEPIDVIVIEENGNRVLLQLGSNRFMSIPKTDIISEQN